MRRNDFDVTRGPTRRILWVALVTGIAFDVAGHNGWVTVAGTLAAIVAAVGLLWAGSIRRLGPVALLVTAAVLGVALAVRTSPWVVTPVALALFGLFLLGASFAATPTAFDRDGDDGEKGDVDPDILLARTFPALAGRLLVALGHVGLAIDWVRRALFGLPPAGSSTEHPTATNRHERIVELGRGLVLALPVVVVIGLLLAAADPVFRSWFDLSLGIEHTFLIVLGAWLLCGLARTRYATHPNADLPSPPRLGSVEATCILGLLAAVYAAFVAAQFVALSGGADHVLATEGLTYADYAREGFFQLLWATAITSVVVLSVRACAGRDHIRLVVLSEIVLGLTLAVVVVAVRRLQLYQEAYGLTPLRLAATVVAVWIGLVLVLVAVAVARRESSARWLAPTVAATAVAFVAVWTLADPAALVARTNLDRAADGQELDVDALVDLGPDAVPTIAAGLDQLAPADRELVVQSLCTDPAEAGTGVAYNRSAALAADALRTVCPDRP